MGVIEPGLRRELDQLDPGADPALALIVSLRAEGEMPSRAELQALGLEVTSEIPELAVVAGRARARAVERIAAHPLVELIERDQEAEATTDA